MKDWTWITRIGMPNEGLDMDNEDQILKWKVEHWSNKIFCLIFWVGWYILLQFWENRIFLDVVQKMLDFLENKNWMFVTPSLESGVQGFWIKLVWRLGSSFSLSVNKVGLGLVASNIIKWWRPHLEKKL